MLLSVIYVYSMVYTINYIQYWRMMGMVRKNCLSYSPLSVIVDCYIWLCWYIQWNDSNGLACWWWWCWIMSTYLLNMLSCLCPSFPTKRIATFSFQSIANLLVVVVVVIVIYIYIGTICSWYYTLWWCPGHNHVAFLLCIFYIVYCIVLQLINYILFGWTMWTVYKLITLLASLLLLLLIVIYDEVGTYNKMVIMDWGLVCWDHVGMDELVQGWQCNNHSCHVTISIVCPMLR